LTSDADHNHPCTVWNGRSNLANLAGKVKGIIRTESEGGFDKDTLLIEVLELLREADLIAALFLSSVASHIRIRS
jgi:hypothetical protein